MFSERFQRTIRITHHAASRMSERHMDDALLLDLIETRTVTHKDDVRLWVFKDFRGRSDNLLCAATALETELVVKAVT